MLVNPFIITTDTYGCKHSTFSNGKFLLDIKKTSFIWARKWPIVMQSVTLFLQFSTMCFIFRIICPMFTHLLMFTLSMSVQLAGKKNVTHSWFRHWQHLARVRERYKEFNTENLHRAMFKKKRLTMHLDELEPNHNLFLTLTEVF